MGTRAWETGVVMLALLWARLTCAALVYSARVPFCSVEPAVESILGFRDRYYCFLHEAATDGSPNIIAVTEVR